MTIPDGIPPGSQSSVPSIMDPVTQTFLVEWMQITLIALAIGLGVISIARMRRPEIQWETGGNVWTGPLHVGDFALVCILLATFYLSVSNAGTVTGDTAPTDALSVSTIIAGSTMMLIIAGVTAGVVGIRGTNIVEFFGLNRMSAPLIVGWGAAGFVVSYAIGLAVLPVWQEYMVTPAIGVPKEQELVGFFKHSASTSERIIIAISACVAAPLAEEFIFRGYVYPVIKRFSEPVFAAVITSAVFALIHMNLQAVPVLFFLSLVLIFAYERSGSIWLPITIHALFNGVNLASMMAPGS